MKEENRKINMQFILICTGQAISMFTSAVLQMAIVWYLTDRTGSAAILSLATLMGFLPQAILGIFIGPFIDRFDKKKTLIVSDLFMAAMGGVLFVASLFGEIPLWMIMLVLFIRSIGNAFYSPALNAIMPIIVPKKELTRFAGYTQGFRSVSMLLSPAVAAVLFSIWNLNVIILFDILGVLIAVVFIGNVKLPCSKRSGKGEQNIHLLREVREGIEVLRKEKGLKELLMISAIYAVIYVPIGTLFPHITMTYFGGSVAQSGTVEVIYAIGMLAGSLMLGMLGHKIDKMKTISVSIFIYGCSILVTGLLPPSGLHIFFIMAILIGFANPLYMGVQVSIYQMKIEENYLGRVLSLNSSVSMMAMPVGLILSGVFADKIGVNRWYMISGILTVVLAVFSRVLPDLRHCCDDIT